MPSTKKQRSRSVIRCIVWLVMATMAASCRFDLTEGSGVDATTDATTDATDAPGSETLSQAAERVMSAFAGCMTLANFQAANMGPAWANLQSDAGPCKLCHADGEAGFIASEDSATAFLLISTKKLFWLQYFAVDLTNGAALAKVVPNTASFAAVSSQQPPHTGHPKFVHPNSAGMSALTTFYNATTATLGTGCPPRPLE